MEKKRNFNADLIRSLAVYLVLSVHFFLKNGFYSEPVVSKRMYLAVILRTMFMACVPLFLMLTGFLMNKKKLCARYFLGIKKTYIIYVMSTIAILIYINYFTNTKITFLSAIGNILSFKQYSWYIEMYIGLFLLIPFLNLIYNNLVGKKQKLALVLTMIGLTTLPSLVNAFGKLIIPNWWVEFYPVTYYFIGAYISEFKNEIKLKLSLNALLYGVTLLLCGAFCILKSNEGIFKQDVWNNWAGFTTLVPTALLFLFLARINTDKTPRFIKFAVTKIAEVSLSVYLVSYIFDNYAYPFLNSALGYMPDRLIYYFAVVPFVFAASLGLALVIDLIYKGLDSLFSLTFKKKKV